MARSAALRNPKTQPEGPAQAPDPRLKGKGHKGSKSSKGSKGKEEGPSKQKEYATRLNRVIESQQIRWFDLGASDPNSADWANTAFVHHVLRVTDDQVRHVDNALWEC